MVGVIYKIINKVNGKIYIGQTSKSLKARWKQHCSHHSSCRLLKKAIQKYGPECFEIVAIDKADSFDELNQKEKMWIEELQCIANGYNLKEGGNNGKLSEATKRKISESNKGLKRSKDAVDAMKRAASNRQKISEKHRQKISKSLATYYKNKGNFELEQCFKSVIQYGLNGNKIKVFPSLKHAEMETGTEITPALRGKTRSAAGYQWRYAYENIEKLEPYEPPTSTAVAAYNVDGTFIRDFESTTEAAKYYNTTYYAIYRVCTGNRKTHKGICFKYKE